MHSFKLYLSIDREETRLGRNLVYQQTSKGDKYIGELGKKIDTKEITKNLLAVNKAIAKALKKLPGSGTTTGVWASTVKQNAPWDYKNNQNTIFGVAWAHDNTQKEKTGTDTKTQFTVSMGETGKTSEMNAADFGNFNAGYTGTHAGISQVAQIVGAGVVEMKKNGGWLGMIGGIIKQTVELNMMFGDNPRDFIFNTSGMQTADEENKQK